MRAGPVLVLPSSASSRCPTSRSPGACDRRAYPGASPEAVEREVTKPLEEALNSIAGVKRITSRSFEGRSQTSVEFSLNADMARAMQDVRDRVAAVQAALPARRQGADRRALQQRQRAAGGRRWRCCRKTRTPRELSILGEQIVGKRLQRVDGVARVDISGLTLREVRIDLDPARLRAYAITPAEIVDARCARPTPTSRSGLLSRPHRRTRCCASRAGCATRGSSPSSWSRDRGDLALTLGDLGQLVEREREPDSLARINGQPAINFNVFKQQDANIVATGEAVKAAMDEMRKTLPPDVELRLIYAISDFVKGSLDGLQQHADRRRAADGGDRVPVPALAGAAPIITGLTLPIAVISSFIAVYAFGFTLNFMTMMALSLCIGLLIDDAIVVRENIVRHVHMGKDHSPRGARGHRRDRPGGDGHHLRDLRGVRAGGLHGRHRRQVLLPVRHHGGGGGAGEPVRQLHARPDAVERSGRTRRRRA